MPRLQFRGVNVFKNWPLWVTLIVAFIGFSFWMNGRIAPDMVRHMAPPLGYIFVPDDDAFVDSEHRLEVDFIPMGREVPTRVIAHIARHPNDPIEELEFEPLFFDGEPTMTWFTVLPPLSKKADKWFYYISIETSEDRQIQLWKSMNWFEKLFTGFKRDQMMFWTTYEGNVVREAPMGRLLLLSHIVTSMGAILFMFHTLYYMMWLFVVPTSKFFRKTWNAMLGAWITFTFGTCILGPPVTWYTFAQGFYPWPLKGLTDLGDITDTKSVLLVIWWGVVLMMNWKYIRSKNRIELDPAAGKKFAWAIFIAILVTIFVFNIPHSQFLT